MSQELNQYGSIAFNYDDEPQQEYNLFAEEEPVAVVAVAPKKTKKQLKEEQEAEERADSKTGRTIAEWREIQAGGAVSADAVAPKPKLTLKTKKQPTKKAVKEVVVAEEKIEPVVAQQVIPSDCEVVDMSVIERMIADAVAPLQQRIKAIEDHEDAQPLKEGRKGYYQVKDGDEELCRVRLQNAALRKEIDAKTKTNQQLQDQLLGDEGNEVVRLRQMNAALRKERDGAREMRKVAEEQIKSLREVLRANGISYEFNNGASKKLFMKGHDEE
jgi:hypothetical protein